jgi:hypothetical protein
MEIDWNKGAGHEGGWGRDCRMDENSEIKINKPF